MTEDGKNFLYRSEIRMNWTPPAAFRFTGTRPHTTTDKERNR
ncbi:hypothetical protein CSE45_1131 [Citreicella sp. SE45]|nr:hypothetical protein CSE45_1131 [Citreicella sp. SE45]